MRTAPLSYHGPPQVFTASVCKCPHPPRKARGRGGGDTETRDDDGNTAPGPDLH